MLLLFEYLKYDPVNINKWIMECLKVKLVESIIPFYIN